jgi:hypothetical protein
VDVRKNSNLRDSAGADGWRQKIQKIREGFWPASLYHRDHAERVSE